MKIIPKYENGGRQDAIKNYKPIIPLKPIKRKFTPTYSEVSPDNKSKWQHQQDSQRADKAYAQYKENQKMQEGLHNLEGFLTFTDYAGLATGVGGLLGKGLKMGAKKLVKKGVNRFGLKTTSSPTGVPNFKGNEFTLTKERLMNGGFDRLEQYGDVSSYSPEQRDIILKSLPKIENSSTMGSNPGKGAYRKTYSVNRDAVDRLTNQQASNVGAHELVHYMYRPSKSQYNELNLNVKQKFSEPIYKDYFNNSRATEQTARGTQLKNYFGFKNGSDDITREMWEHAKKNYVKDTGMDNDMTEWFNSVKEEDLPYFLKWLNNNSPMLTTPIIGGTIYGNNK